jgi:peptidoglycan/LPS O-acetylase OafA/YrhL
MAQTELPVPPPNYQPHIDGMRALAVLIVVFFHLGVPGFAGGFVGVDVFFVISGYLIGGIILRQTEAGTFSIAAFYNHRIRRILPALLTMLLVVTGFVYQFLFPPEIADYGHTLRAALLSTSNLLFSQDVGYFDIAGQAKPLLHTWSLAVEEQFYFALPLLLLVLTRWWPRAIKPVLCVLALSSFAWSCWLLQQNARDAAFFQTPSRAWELLLGVLLVDRSDRGVSNPRARQSTGSAIASLAGLFLILVPAYQDAPPVPYPGFNGLSPCLGAALLLIHGGSEYSWVGKVLAWRPLVFLGLISYSLYLWHWPIHVLQMETEFLVSERHHANLVTPVVLAVSLFVAILSWRFIELPFRTGRLSRRLWLYPSVASVALCLAFTAHLIDENNGGPIPHLPLTTETARFIRFNLTWPLAHPGDCFIGNLSQFTPTKCLEGGPQPITYLLMGDSHAYQLYNGLQTVFPEFHTAQATMYGCRPLVHSKPWVPATCVQMNAFLFGDYLLHHHFDYVILSGLWEDLEAPELGETVTWVKAHGMEPIVFGPTVLYNMSLPRLISISQRNQDDAIFARHRTLRADQVDRQFALLARTVWKVRYVSFFEDLCGVKPEVQASVTMADCPVFANGTTPMLRDDNHISAQGSVRWFEVIKSRNELPYASALK